MHKKHTCGTVGPGWIEEQVFQAALWEKYTNLCFDQFSWSSEPHNSEIRPTATLKKCFLKCWSSEGMFFVTIQQNTASNRPCHSSFSLVYPLLNQCLLHFTLCSPPADSAQSCVKKRKDTWYWFVVSVRHDLTDSPGWPVTCYCRLGCPRT